MTSLILVGECVLAYAWPPVRVCWALLYLQECAVEIHALCFVGVYVHVHVHVVNPFTHIHAPFTCIQHVSLAHKYLEALNITAELCL